MRPKDLKTKIFLDSGDPQETKEALAFLGFLDGQTTNPSLVAKNPEAQGRLARGEKFSAAEVLNFYQGVVKEVSRLLPEGSVSVEVYSDRQTLAEDMLKQGREFFAWIPNAHIKFPTTTEGLKAAERAAKEKMRVNMTLVFSQAQAAAVYSATRGAQKGQIFISPFVGRLDDIGQYGMGLVANIIRMYQAGDSHVEVLAASVRSLEHFSQAIYFGANIITAPLKVLKQWADAGMPIESEKLKVESPASARPKAETGDKLLPIAYQQIDLNRPWTEFDIKHELTDKGLEKFAADWNALIE